MNDMFRRPRPMADVLLVLLLLLAPFTALAERFYPTIAEVELKLDELETTYPDLAKKYLIGTSVVEDKDIYALKISSDVDEQQDKPVWIFTGVIHGNEHMGLKVVMDLATRLTGEYLTNAEVKKWVDAYDIWLVPYMNPVGYQYRVRGNRQVNWVDLNRNYDFHWQNGQATPGASAYRGTAPFSEPEAQAMRDLYLEIQPWFGMVFHYGNNPDGGQIMYPWSSTNGGFNPDRAALRGFAQKYGDLVFAARSLGEFCEVASGGGYVLEDPDGDPCGSTQTEQYCKELCWTPSISTQGILGISSNWGYAAVGTMDLTVEMTDRAFYLPFMHENRAPETAYEQTILDIATEFANNYLDGIEALFDDFLIPASTGYDFRASGVTGHVLDEDTSEPVRAKIEFIGHTSAEVEDRYSNEQFGRFWRFLPNGSHTITVSAPGYISHTETFTLSTDVMKNMQILLEKQP
ncbi:M14 family zinc carboxypeptidase [Luteimonas sp. R10]|uniref:M14 family zinc carboxypeptidase n=1 Tax=Luteimonas sp. R10 TaxID=3108176 RepID=UPI003087FA8A|nr:M14 family zinc carboxypeptidase [Luteimonas sp. R10]